MGLFSPTWSLRPCDKGNKICQSLQLDSENQARCGSLTRQRCVDGRGWGALFKWLVTWELGSRHMQPPERRAERRPSPKSPRKPSRRAFRVQLDRRMAPAAGILQEPYSLSVTEKMPGTRTVRPPSSGARPGVCARVTCGAPPPGFPVRDQVMLMPLGRASLLGGARWGTPAAEGDAHQLRAPLGTGCSWVTVCAADATNREATWRPLPPKPSSRREVR